MESFDEALTSLFEGAPLVVALGLALLGSFGILFGLWYSAWSFRLDE